MIDIPIKHNPLCTNIVNIPESQCMGDSLSSINFNLSAIETSLCNISFSGIIWDGLYDTVNTLSGGWQSMYDTVNSLSGSWQSAYLTVSQLSSFWIDPITIVYPSVSAISTTDIPTVTSFVDANFPAGAYLDGQEFYVYTFEYETQSLQLQKQYSATISKQTVNCAQVECGCHAPCPWENITCPADTITCNGKTTTKTETWSWEDNYSKEVFGIKMRVVNSLWEYIENLPSADCEGLI